jgi:Tol biopolymer transport system component
MRTFHYLSLVFLFLSCYQNLQAQLQISQQEIGGRMKCLAYSPNGLYYAVGTDRDTYVFNAEGKEIKKLPFPTFALQFSPDSKTILTGSVRAGLFLWSLAGGPFLKTYLSSDEQSDVMSLAFSADGQQIIAGYKSGKIKAWNTHTGTPVELLAPEKKIAPINNTALKKVAPAKVAEAKDTTLARSDEEDEAMGEGLTDEDTGVFGMADEYPEEEHPVAEDSNDQPEKEPINPSPSIVAISWSVDGKKLLICKEKSKELTLIQGGKQSVLLKHPFSAIVRAIFSLDGKNIITGN